MDQAPEKIETEEFPCDENHDGYRGPITRYMVCHDGSKASCIAL